MNTTQELLDKYRKLLAPILGCQESELEFKTEGENIAYFAYGEKFEKVYDSEGVLIPYTERSEYNKCRFKLGHYSIHIASIPYAIASFRLYEMPHCCAIIISCNASVAIEYRNKGIGKILNQFRQDIGRLLGYSTMMCTDIDQNTAQRKVLKANGWKDVHSVVNKRTQNKVYVSVIDL